MSAEIGYLHLTGHNSCLFAFKGMCNGNFAFKGAVQLLFCVMQFVLAIQLLKGHIILLLQGQYMYYVAVILTKLFVILH